jgi:hypothetical protein
MVSANSRKARLAKFFRKLAKQAGARERGTFMMDLSFWEIRMILAALDEKPEEVQP